MPSPFGRSALPLTACAASLIAAILLVLSYASPYWSSDAIYSHGLWRRTGCRSLACWNYDYYHHVPPWLKAVRAMETMAVIVLSLPVVVVPIYLYASHGLYYRTMNLIAAGMCLASGIFIIIGVIIYGSFAMATMGRDLGWCFVVCLISGIICILAFLLFLVAAIVRRPPKPVYYASHSVLMDTSAPTTIYTIEKDHSATGYVVD
ncbi:uncharacterized protein LOC135471634 [Liolophura sinensis]|uniref:uncharacterized protein LOC135471634 n=1 Tax=Liolophura sinensis TaxID=3198878 RepID=UPI0031581252